MSLVRLSGYPRTWKGLVEHALDGWNIGPAPYGYQADRIPHPVPAKASQGRTKTRLALDPQRAPVVEQIFTWRVVRKLGMPTIAAKLNADPARYPAPTGKGWTTQTVYAVLGNPKYTGHMVYGRIRNRNGRRVTVPASEWLWSPGPVHPAIVHRATWAAAQQISAEHSTSRDGDALAGTRPRPGPTPTGAGSGAGTAAAGWPPAPTPPRPGPACTTSARTTPPTRGTPPPPQITPAPSKPPNPASMASSGCSSKTTFRAPPR